MNYPISIEDYDGQPPHGSVILLNGTTGTAFQRFFMDGKYHGTTGKVMTYEQILEPRQRALIVYIPNEED